MDLAPKVVARFNNSLDSRRRHLGQPQDQLRAQLRAQLLDPLPFQIRKPPLSSPLELLLKHPLGKCWESLVVVGLVCFPLFLS